MKIAFYELHSTVSRGGIQSFVWGLADALSGRGHAVHIYGGKGNILPAMKSDVTVHRFPFVPRQYVPNFGSRFRKFGERLTFNCSSLMHLVQGKYDIIYINKSFDMPGVLLAGRLSKSIVIYGSHGTEFFPLYRYFAEKLDAFFSCSNFNASQVEEYCGIRPRVLYNGIDVDRFAPREPDLSLRRALGVDDGMKILASACRLIGWKGIQYAIMAVRSVVRDGRNVKYLIIGDGEYRKTLEALVRSAGLEENVIFLGAIPNEELPRYYSIVDVALFPSVSDETFGISIAEAMACGVPVVSTKVGGIQEVVTEGTGLLVPPRDEGAIAGAIYSLLRDEDLRRKFARQGRQWVVENFNWNRVADRFMEYVAPVLERRREKG